MKIDVVSSFHLKQKGFAAKSVESSNSYRLTPNPFCPPLPHSHANSSNHCVFIRIKFSTFVIQKRGLFVFYGTELNTCVHTHTRMHARICSNNWIPTKRRAHTIETKLYSTLQISKEIFVLIIIHHGIEYKDKKSFVFLSFQL